MPMKYPPCSPRLRGDPTDGRPSGPDADWDRGWGASPPLMSSRRIVTIFCYWVLRNLSVGMTPTGENTPHEHFTHRRPNVFCCYHNACFRLSRYPRKLLILRSSNKNARLGLLLGHDNKGSTRMQGETRSPNERATWAPVPRWTPSRSPSAVRRLPRLAPVSVPTQTADAPS